MKFAKGDRYVLTHSIIEQSESESWLSSERAKIAPKEHMALTRENG